MGGTRILLRGHYNPTVKSRKYPNLQWTRLPAGFAAKAGLKEGARLKACTQCLRTLAKGKMPKKRKLPKKRKR